MADPRPVRSDLRRAAAHRITPEEYDEAPELTDEMLDRAHAFHGDRYLGPARAVAANGWEPVVGPKEQHRSVLDVLKGESRQG
jgi:hypothetical protein